MTDRDHPSIAKPDDVDEFLLGWVVHREGERLLIRLGRDGDLYVDAKPIIDGVVARVWMPVAVTAPTEKADV